MRNKATPVKKALEKAMMSANQIADSCDSKPAILRIVGL
jgi:hypothetical protein